VKYPDLRVFPLFTWRVPNESKALISEKERRLGMHAGDAETSLMLAVLPDWVKMEKAVAEYPPERPQGSLLGAKGSLTFAWLTHHLSKSGVIGDGTVATKEKGDRIWDSLTEGWVRVIQEVYEFPSP
ncbi:MAG TPA: creatininase family protein, partial [Vampirovibrionales bacterium]